MYYPQANGLAKDFNKTLCNILKKVVSKSKKNWHEKIEEALWAYKTMYRTPTQSTPYALVYGVEAVLPLELQIPSLRNANMVPKWDGPHVVQEAYTSGSYLLADQEGQKVGPINGRYLKWYYP
ncbi:hypothetical protein LIER_08377 [Lithospermum erythrorhizon]|uniref:Integrase catalytic domain-containing protein n=1 Tax=Lithospermum erythrorhizon TaxID=34254 RepID=A0AAV3PG31_LITER